MKHSVGALLAFTTTASLLTACGSGTTGLPPGTGGNCGPPSVQLKVLYPIPNSLRVSGNLRKIYIATNRPLPGANLYEFLLRQSNGSSTRTSSFFGISKSEIPTPHARISFSTPTYYATSIPSGYRIGPREIVKLYWAIPGAGCSPNTLMSSFRTRRARS